MASISDLSAFLAKLIQTPAYHRFNARDIAKLRAVAALIKEQDNQSEVVMSNYRDALRELIDARVRLQMLVEMVQAGLQAAQEPESVRSFPVSTVD